MTLQDEPEKNEALLVLLRQLEGEYNSMLRAGKLGKDAKLSDMEEGERLRREIQSVKEKLNPQS
jgi:hypothetical protein